MKIHKTFLFLIVMVLLASFGCSMAGTDAVQSSVSRLTQNWELWEPMDSFNSDVMHKADWANHSMFNVGWEPEHVTFMGGIMSLTLTDTPSVHGYPYTSGEYRTNNFFSYGTFEANLKSAKGSGLNTGFFLYSHNPWDEIDFEFLGKDTTQVQLNYWVDGVGDREVMIDLGFDASEMYHKYTIEWGEGYIKWFVDGSLVHTATGGSQPTHDMQIMMNLWTGTGVESWLGAFSYSGPVSAYFDYVKYTPPDSSSTTKQTVALRAQVNNSYVCAENSGTTSLVASQGTVGTWESFTLVSNSDGTVSLKSLANDMYVCAESSGSQPLIANRSAIGDWEKFKIINNSDGSLSLQSMANNMYVCAESGGSGSLIANRSAIGLWEKFDLIYQ